MSTALRNAVAARAGSCCEYCLSQERFAVQSFSVEHIQPRRNGGSDDLSNLAYSCQGCNNHKFTKTHATDPLSGAEVPLFDPRRHVWAEHFAWNDDCSELVGQTPTGRATGVLLRVNRPNVVNLRRVLFAAGLHPPTATLPSGGRPS